MLLGWGRTNWRAKSRRAFVDASSPTCPLPAKELVGSRLSRAAFAPPANSAENFPIFVRLAEQLKSLVPASICGSYL
jgi:hypothetical protein